MFSEKIVQHLCVITVSLGVQVQFPDAAIGVMLQHVFTKSDFPALLLVRTYNTFVYLAENYDFPFPACKQHHHSCGKISTLVRILSEKGEGRLIFQIRVYIYIRYRTFVQFLCERFRILRYGRGEHNPVRFLFQDIPGNISE